MIPYSYNMVDMGGIDLAEANGTIVSGLYNKIVEAVNACGDVVFYNWKFAGIEIAPQYTSILLGDPIIINGAVQVTEQDEVTVPGINPEPPPLPPPPVLVPLSVNENGHFIPIDYDADGFSEVSVNVSGTPLSYSKPDMQMFNSAGNHQLSLDTSYQHALIAVVARGDFSTSYTPIYEESLDQASIGVESKAYIYLINPSEGFSFSSTNNRVNFWIIYTNRSFAFQAEAIKATVVQSQFARYELQNLAGNYFCLIYNSWTNETADASMVPSPIAIGSNKALRYTYAIISSPKATSYVYTINITMNPSDNSNYIILIKEE